MKKTDCQNAGIVGKFAGTLLLGVAQIVGDIR